MCKDIWFGVVCKPVPDRPCFMKGHTFVIELYFKFHIKYAHNFPDLPQMSGSNLARVKNNCMHAFKSLRFSGTLSHLRDFNNNSNHTLHGHS